MRLSRWSLLVTVNSLALATLLAPGALAQEDYTSIGFTGNYVLQDVNSAYPSGNLLLGDVPFNIPTTGNNLWLSQIASGGSLNSGGAAGTVSLTVPIDVYGVNEVDTLANTLWGQAGSTTTSLTFTGSGGATFTKTLVEGTDIRDWYNDGYVNTINGTTTTQVFLTTNSSFLNGTNGSRLDKQQILLPSVFDTQTLESITITDSGAPGVQRAWLAGVTVGVAAVPEPDSLYVGVIGILCGGMLLRRQRQLY